MNPIHLKTFLAVRKYLNYSHAGKELFLSQPAVSRQVRQLENELGVRLFEQIGKTIHLTDAGRTLAAEAERVLGNMERVAEAVAVHRSAATGRLRIGASTTPGFYLLPKVVGQFHRKYPGVEIEFSIANSQRIQDKVLRNEIDLGFIGSVAKSTDIETKAIAHDEIVCFSSPRHSLSKHRKPVPETLRSEICVIREEGSGTRQMYDEWLNRRGIELQRTIKLSCPEAVKALVGAGVGFSFLSIHVLRGELSSGKLRRLPINGFSLERPINLIRHKEKYESPVITEFLKMLAR